MDAGPIITAPIITAVHLPVTAERAFELFLDDFGTWWPREYSWSGPDGLQSMGIDPRVGGPLYEIGPHGLRWDWGRVLDVERPRRIHFTWQIGPDRVPVPDPAQASEVIVLFDPIEERATTVAVEHKLWDRHGERAGEYREAFADAWPTALARLADLAAD